MINTVLHTDRVSRLTGEMQFRWPITRVCSSKPKGRRLGLVPRCTHSECRQQSARWRVPVANVSPVMPQQASAAQAASCGDPHSAHGGGDHSYKSTIQ